MPMTTCALAVGTEAQMRRAARLQSRAFRPRIDAPVCCMRLVKLRGSADWLLLVRGKYNKNGYLEAF